MKEGKEATVKEEEKKRSNEERVGGRGRASPRTGGGEGGSVKWRGGE